MLINITIVSHSADHALLASVSENHKTFQVQMSEKW